MRLKISMAHLIKTSDKIFPRVKLSIQTECYWWCHYGVIFKRLQACLYSAKTHFCWHETKIQIFSFKCRCSWSVKSFATAADDFFLWRRVLFFCYIYEMNFYSTRGGILSPAVDECCGICSSFPTINCSAIMTSLAWTDCCWLCQTFSFVPIGEWEKSWNEQMTRKLGYKSFARSLTSARKNKVWNRLESWENLATWSHREIIINVIANVRRIKIWIVIPFYETIFHVVCCKSCLEGELNFKYVRALEHDDLVLKARRRAIKVTSILRLLRKKHARCNKIRS